MIILETISYPIRVYSSSESENALSSDSTVYYPTRILEGSGLCLVQIPGMFERGSTWDLTHTSSTLKIIEGPVNVEMADLWLTRYAQDTSPLVDWTLSQEDLITSPEYIRHKGTLKQMARLLLRIIKHEEEGALLMKSYEDLKKGEEGSQL